MNMVTDPEILEGNRLIAVYHGYRLVENHPDYEICYTMHPLIDLAVTPDHGLMYHEDWNMLMSVIDQLDKDECYWFKLDYNTREVVVKAFREQMRDDIVIDLEQDEGLSPDISMKRAAWLAVVKVVKHINAKREENNQFQYNKR